MANGHWISRSLHLMEHGLPTGPFEERCDRRQEVRILVYGQSISKQDWWLQVRAGLQERFPLCRIIMTSRAIGGFDSSRLVNCAEQDALLFSPDLILFHDYGPEDQYEQIIRILRSCTPAEIAVQNDHVALGQDNAWHDRHSFEWLPDLCERYQMELIDVRSAWKNYLEARCLEPQALLSDEVHLNEAGNRLMGQIVLNALTYQPENGPDPQNLVATLCAGVDFEPERAIILPVEGLRVDLTCSAGCRMNVRVDGLRPTARPWSFIAESPWLSAPHDRPERVGMPIRVELGEHCEGDLWELMVKEVIDDGAEVRFSLYSKHNGFEGRGTSDENFTAESGRVKLLKKNWFLRETPDFFSPLPAVQAGDTLRWEVVRLCCDDLYHDSPGTCTILNHLPPGKHSLALYNIEEHPLPVELIHIYRRPYQR